MGNKTKVQLEQEIAELRVQVKEQGRIERNDEAAKELHNLYESYVIS